jgi:hypothetical protein
MEKHLVNHAGFESLYLPLALLEQLELLEMLSSLSLEMILLLSVFLFIFLSYRFRNRSIEMEHGLSCEGFASAL